MAFNSCLDPSLLTRIQMYLLEPSMPPLNILSFQLRSYSSNSSSWVVNSRRCRLYWPYRHRTNGAAKWLDFPSILILRNISISQTNNFLTPAFPDCIQYCGVIQFQNSRVSTATPVSTQGFVLPYNSGARLFAHISLCVGTGIEYNLT